MRKIKAGKKKLTLVSLVDAVDFGNSCEVDGFKDFLNSIDSYCLYKNHVFEIGISLILNEQLEKYPDLAKWLVDHEFAEYDEPEYELPVFAIDGYRVFVLLRNKDKSFQWRNAETNNPDYKVYMSVFDAIICIKSSGHKFYTINYKTRELEELYV